MEEHEVLILGLANFVGNGQEELKLKGLERKSLNSSQVVARDPSPVLAIGQTVVVLAELVSDAMGVQSGLDINGRPLVYIGSSEASTGPSENPGSLHKRSHQ